MYWRRSITALLVAKASAATLSKVAKPNGDCIVIVIDMTWLNIGNLVSRFSPYPPLLDENIYLHTIHQVRVKDGNDICINAMPTLILSSCFKNSMVDLVIRLDFYMRRDFNKLGGLCNPLPNFKASNHDNFAIIELYAEGKFCFALLTASPTYVCLCLLWINPSS